MMMAVNQPEIAGPGAMEVEAIPDSTGFSNNDKYTEATEVSEPEIDPSFPFGRPENIDWDKLDPAGIGFISELNQRAWIKSTEYCSGHPLNRPINEKSEWYPYISGENVYEETAKLDMAFISGGISDIYFRTRKQEIRQCGATRFYLNVNVYSTEIFQQWVRLFSTMLTLSTNSSVNPLVVRFNPLRLGFNYTIHWDYWTLEERNMIHALAMDSLMHFPV